MKNENIELKSQVITGVKAKSLSTNETSRDIVLNVI